MNINRERILLLIFEYLGIDCLGESFGKGIPLELNL